jgi:hypothetical protein
MQLMPVARFSTDYAMNAFHGEFAFFLCYVILESHRQ